MIGVKLFEMRKSLFLFILILTIFGLSYSAPAVNTTTAKPTDTMQTYEKAIIGLFFILVAAGLAAAIYYKCYLEQQIRGYDEFPDEIDKPKGIKNTGSSCYLNAVLQVLASSDVLIEQLENLEKEDYGMLKMLLNILHKINTPDLNISAEQLSEEVNTLIQACGWNKPDQQDAFDLLSKVINAIEVEIQSKHDLKKDFIIPLKFKMVQVYKNDTRNTVQKYLGLPLPLPNENEKNCELESMLTEFFQEFRIDDDPEYACNYAMIDEAPQILLLHIQANRRNQSGGMYKPDYKITFSITLQWQFPCLSQDKINDKSQKVEKKMFKYNLVGTVIHAGSIGGGHYWAIRKYEASWFDVNDSSVNIFIPEDPLELSPYLLMYEREP